MTSRNNDSAKTQFPVWHGKLSMGTAVTTRDFSTHKKVHVVTLRHMRCKCAHCNVLATHSQRTATHCNTPSSRVRSHICPWEVPALVFECLAVPKGTWLWSVLHAGNIAFLVWWKTWLTTPPPHYNSAVVSEHNYTLCHVDTLRLMVDLHIQWEEDGHEGYTVWFLCVLGVDLYGRWMVCLGYGQWMVLQWMCSRPTMNECVDLPWIARYPHGIIV